MEKAELERQSTRASGRAQRINAAIGHLRSARDLLRGNGAGKAADAVARAMKSAEGAQRHARRQLDALDRELDQTHDAAGRPTCPECGDILTTRANPDGPPTYCDTCDREVRP